VLQFSQSLDKRFGAEFRVKDQKADDEEIDSGLDSLDDSYEEKINTKRKLKELQTKKDTLDDLDDKPAPNNKKGYLSDSDEENFNYNTDNIKNATAEKKKKGNTSQPKATPPSGSKFLELQK